MFKTVETKSIFDHIFGPGGEFDQAFGPVQTATESVTYDDLGDSYEFSLDVPGVKKEDLAVKAKDNVLSISGKRKETSFNKTIKLPQSSDTERVEAQLQDGVLSVRIWKTKAVSPRMIPIK